MKIKEKKELCEKCHKNPATAYTKKKHVCQVCFFLLTQKIKQKDFYICANCHRRFKKPQIFKQPFFCCEKCKHIFYKNLKGGNNEK